MLRNSKASGIDGVIAEGWWRGTDHSFTFPAEVGELRKFRRHGSRPLSVKGDGCDCKNYRRISLLSITGMVFTGVIQARLKRQRECTARKEQAGLHTGRGCCDQIFLGR